MSKEAFDTKEQKPVEAADCIPAYKGRYVCQYCHDNGVDVPVYVRTTDGEKTFVSYDIHQHIRGCRFPIYQEYKNVYSPDFSRDSLLVRLQELIQEKKQTNTASNHSSGTGLKHSKRPTLKWLYHVCITNDNSHEFAEGCTVENSCLKQGTLGYWYGKDKTQYPLLIIGMIKKYNTDNLTLVIAIGKYKINAVFEQKTVFLKFIAECKMSNGKTKDTPVYLYGCLKNTDSLQTVSIVSRKQIDIVS
ncbi:MAG: hypothetical protein VZR73_01310 [Acutalibacteraceae bacterium]|nr:hypothetical protein [Acutalibacteraceae bacterium]